MVSDGSLLWCKRCQIERIGSTVDPDKDPCPECGLPSVRLTEANDWIFPATKADLVLARQEGDPVDAWHEVAQEWRPSPVPADLFEQWGPGPTVYRVGRAS